MIPIVLTKYGESLYGGTSGGEDINLPDNKKFSVSLVTEPPLSIGIHVLCNGAFYINRVSLNHNAINCGRCGLRVLIPVEVDTYGKLRGYFTEERKIWEEMREKENNII